MAERVAHINPRCAVEGLPVFFEAATTDALLGPEDEPARFDAVLDCIDNMTAKVHLLETCVRRGIRVSSAMGAGGRMDPTRVRLNDLADTHTVPFARIVRDQLRQRGITRGIEVVWTDEPPNDLDADAKASFRCICPGKDENTKHSCERRFQVQGTVAWMPAVFGLTLAAATVGHLVGMPLAHAPVARPGRRRAEPVAVTPPAK
jgi:tRNA threonylcarbamoyladenosine dehydratase